jgi:hypothetical protein
MSEANMTLAWIEIYGLITSKGTVSRKARRMLLSRSALLRSGYKQERYYCFVEKRKRMTFLSKHFNSYLVICDTIFFADKNKVNSIHLS